MYRKNVEEKGRCRSVFATEMGFCGVVASADGLLEVFTPFGETSGEEMLRRIAARYPLAVEESQLTRQAADQLARYFAGEAVTFDLAVDRQGFTPFQQAVYEVVARIPYGTVKTYADVAGEANRPWAARGVGTAMARNPLPVIIPCHRVVGGSGDMTGYSAPGGVASKRLLLAMEGMAFDRSGRIK
jgi:methylated-DNA-[protein]-cysteine S-methyltransferase